MSLAKLWTPERDHFLIFYGHCLERALGKGKGYAFVCSHDLDVEPSAGIKRMEWLRANRPLLVKQLEAEADKEEVE